MNAKELVDKLSLYNQAAALGGCKVHKTTLDCCEYNITIFDDITQKDEIKTIGTDVIRIHHGMISESSPDVLQKYENMQILSDPEWSLGIFFSNLNEKQEKIRNSCAKSCLVDAAFFATKAKQNISDPFAAVWIKCAAYLICDGMVLLNSQQRSPTHMLEYIRKFDKKNESFSVMAEIIGLERATQSQLERMVKSTIGFSDMTEDNNSGVIIQKKYEYLVANALLSDCYFYLGYVNKNNVLSIRDDIHKRQDLIHVLKTALDLEHDPTKLEQQAAHLHKTANNLLHLQNYA